MQAQQRSGRGEPTHSGESECGGGMLRRHRTCCGSVTTSRPSPSSEMAPRAAQVKCRQRRPSDAHHASGRADRRAWVTSPLVITPANQAGSKPMRCRLPSAPAEPAGASEMRAKGRPAVAHAAWFSYPAPARAAELQAEHNRHARVLSGAQHAASRREELEMTSRRIPLPASFATASTAPGYGFCPSCSTPNWSSRAPR